MNKECRNLFNILTHLKCVFINCLSYINNRIFNNWNFPSTTLTSRIQKALQPLEQDEAMQNAIYSLYVVNNKTGEIVFNKNGQYGLAPASCQKIIKLRYGF